MTPVQIVLVVISALVIGASVAVAAGALKDDDDESEPAASASGSTTKRPPTAPRAINRVPQTRVVGCRNLKLSAAERSSLEAGVFKHEAVKGSVYFGTCDGSVWSMARFESGGDGVFRNVRSDDSRRLGSIAEAKCDVPERLLRLWRRYEGCSPRQVVREPPPEPPAEPPAEPRESDTYPPGDSRRRYPNGRTYIEQVNWCNLMRAQGVPCTVPPPP